MSDAFVYPWSYAGTPTTPPGPAPNWVRLQLANNLGADIAPESQVETETGWVLPIDAVGQLVRVQLPSTTYTIGTTPVVQQNQRWDKVVSATPIAAVDVKPQVGIPSSLAGIGVVYRAEEPTEVSGMPSIEYADNVPYSGKATVGPGWAPAPDPGDPHPQSNELVFAQQFTATEVADIRNLLAGGTTGGGNATMSYQNAGVTPLIRGMPVHSDTPGLCLAARGNVSDRAVVGLYYDVTTLPNGSVGNVLVDGELTQDAASWQLVTGEAGGLVVTATYYLSFTQPGRLVRIPNVDSAPPNSYLVAVGYALTTTTMKLEIQPSVRVS